MLPTSLFAIWGLCLFVDSDGLQSTVVLFRHLFTFLSAVPGCGGAPTPPCISAAGGMAWPARMWGRCRAIFDLGKCSSFVRVWNTKHLQLPSHIMHTPSRYSIRTPDPPQTLLIRRARDLRSLRVVQAVLSASTRSKIFDSRRRSPHSSPARAPERCAAAGCCGGQKGPAKK